MSMSCRRVTVAGGGIAGLCCAYFLARAGAEVTVLEARRVGSGASWANAGWISPVQAGPLPEPGLLGYGIRSLIDRRSALYFSPGYLPRMLPWAVRFAGHCNRNDHRRGAAHLAQLGARSFELLEQMARDGVHIGMTHVPLLVVAEREQHASQFLAKLEALAAHGLPVSARLLSADEARESEPAIVGPAAAAVLISQHGVVDAKLLLQSLRQRLDAMEVGVIEGTEVTDVELAGGRLVALHSSNARFPCDGAVFATGAWLGETARLLRAHLPIEAGKGYSLDVHPRTMPRHALMLLESHLALSPLDGRLRIAGTMEFSGRNMRLDNRRLRVMAAGARRMIGDWTEPEQGRPWCGLRPVTPDGLPIIRRHPRLDNVIFAGGYAMLGMTLAAPAATTVTRLLLGP